MAASDDENQSGESEPYAITSASGIEYGSEATFGDMIRRVRDLLGESGRIAKKKLTLARDLLTDIEALVDANTGENEVGIDVDDELDVLELPDGWSTDLEDEDGEDE